MTEQEWLAGLEPQRMIGFMWDKASERKRRLLAVACCRRVWRFMTDARSRETVQAAEAHAEQQLTRKALHGAWRNAEMAYAAAACGNIYEVMWATWAAVHASARNPREHQACQSSWDATLPKSARRGAHSDADKAEQARLIWELYGNPFRPVLAAPAWLTPTVTALAQAANEERVLPEGGLDQGRLFVLADALEEAGCTDPTILGHLRGPGPHVRGCWPIDLALGKE
jgi:hypothetical protein